MFSKIFGGMGICMHLTYTTVAWTATYMNYSIFVNFITGKKLDQYHDIS